MITELEIEKENYKIVMHNVYFETAQQSAQQIQEILSNIKNIDEKVLIEVSFDQYDEIQKIIENTEDVKQGAFTYEQVRHIAEGCCLHELHIGDQNELYVDSTVLSMSAIISFAQSKWNGADRQTAIKNAIYTGMSIFEEAFAEEIIFNELNGMNEDKIHVKKSVKTAVAKNGVKVVSKKMATGITKKAMISSAVAKKTIMFLNANVVTGALVTGVLSTIDISRTIKGKLSPQQLFKNIVNTAASVAGGMIGMVLFAGIGLKIPSVSTALISLIGGIIGLILGSVLLSKITSKILDYFIEDDAKKMLVIFQQVLQQRSEFYLLNAEELEQAIEDFNARQDLKDELREMYASENQAHYAQQLIDQELMRIINHRMYLHIPKNEEIYEMLETL